MNPEDKRSTILRYEQRFLQFGRDPRTLGWGKGGRQEIRFSVLSAEALKNPTCSVLDIGCGFADLFSYLTRKGWSGTYTGVELSPMLISEAKKTAPSARFILGDITDVKDQIPKHDYVIACGVCNHRLENQDTKTYVMEFIKNCFELSKTCLCMDFMSSFVDFEAEGAWHTDPRWLLLETRALSRRVSIRADYMPYEFAMFLYKNDDVSQSNVFVEHGAA